MKKIKIVGERRTGRSTMLINSMFVHLIDDTLKEDLVMIASASNAMGRQQLNNGLVEKLSSSKINFSASINKIEVNGRTCLFLPPDPRSFIGIKFDYVFLDNVEFFDSRFIDFIDTIIRPNVIVVQTHEEKSLFFKEVPHKD